MGKVAVILSGCGYLDGAEIREAVFTILFLDKHKINYDIFAPNINQHHTINHKTNEEVKNEKRNILVESARIARGDIDDMVNLKVSDYAALILPGGFGVAKNFSDLAFNGIKCKVTDNISKVINDFYKNKKPIGAICISPAIVTKALSDKGRINVTIGDDNDKLIENLGGIHTKSSADNIVFDNNNLIITTPAYMLNEDSYKISLGIEKLIIKIAELIK